jgi:hypothetical protein
MSKGATRTHWNAILPRWILAFVIILVWEFFTLPVSSHTSSWRGVWLSFICVLGSAVWISQAGARQGTLFVFGCASALLFVPRFLFMDRFKLWLQYQAPNNTVIMCCWVGFALLLGIVCSTLGSARPGDQQ